MYIRQWKKRLFPPTPVTPDRAAGRNRASRHLRRLSSAHQGFFFRARAGALKASRTQLSPVAPRGGRPVIFHCRRCLWSPPSHPLVIRDKGQEERHLSALNLGLPTRPALSRCPGLRRNLRRSCCHLSGHLKDKQNLTGQKHTHRQRDILISEQVTASSPHTFGARRGLVRALLPRPLPPHLIPI